MPSPYIKSLAKETGKTEKELEKLWNKAKKIAIEIFNKEEKDFGSKEYKYVVGIVKNMAGIKEEIIDPTSFLKSDLSADQFIETTLVSSNFSISNVRPPKKTKKDKDEIDYENLLKQKTKEVKK